MLSCRVWCKRKDGTQLSGIVVTADPAARAGRAKKADDSIVYVGDEAIDILNRVSTGGPLPESIFFGQGVHCWAPAGEQISWGRCPQVGLCRRAKVFRQGVYRWAPAGEQSVPNRVSTGGPLQGSSGTLGQVLLGGPLRGRQGSLVLNKAPFRQTVMDSAAALKPAQAPSLAVTYFAAARR